MRGRTRQRVVRLFVAAVLDSDLTAQEIRDLQLELDDGDIHRELSYILRMLANHVGSHDEIRRRTAPISAERLYEAAKKKRMAKSYLIEVLNSMASSYMQAEPSMSVREILDEFVAEVPEKIVIELLTFLESSSPGDQYLRGILERKKED